MGSSQGVDKQRTLLTVLVVLAFSLYFDGQQNGSHSV
jgi:hypothetical protein